MTIKVYGAPRSSGVGRVLATLFETDVTDFENVKIDMKGGANHKPDYLALQPFGQIPVMVDGPLTLFESRAIARYIALKFEGKGTSLYGSSLKERALVEQWLEVESHNFNPPITAIIACLLGMLWRGEQADEAVVKAHVEKLNKVLDVYDAHLAKNKYIAGDFFSLADISHLPTIHHLIFNAKRRDVIEARPHVNAWWEDISSRPSWKKVLNLGRHQETSVPEIKPCREHTPIDVNFSQ